MLAGGEHPVANLDRSFEQAIASPGYIMFSTKMSEGRPAYRLDLCPPYALRGVNGHLIALLERVRSRETPHSLVFHGKSGEHSLVDAKDHSQYYRISVCSTPVVSREGQAAGLRHVGSMSGGLRTAVFPMCTLMSPPGLYTPGVAVTTIQEGGGGW